MTQDELTITQRINQEIKDVLEDKNEISDGYHTFGELYEHRITLFIALCKLLSESKHNPMDVNPWVWKSIIHSDGTLYVGWFIMGINTSPGKQITYHLPMSKWDITNFVPELDIAPEFDGHTSEDVLDRLNKFFIND